MVDAEFLVRLQSLDSTCFISDDTVWPLCMPTYPSLGVLTAPMHENVSHTSPAHSKTVHGQFGRVGQV